uniref:nucleotidyltransferase family protein n=1 Tax=Ningiella ruwaisensis TaxID=2364274 RepID=UPI00109FA06C|nr:nucleotidyltransferase family protein [Ningiella ruwaisensis]
MNARLSVSDLVTLFLRPESVLDYSPSRLSKAIIVLREQRVLGRYCYRFEQAGVLEKLDERAQRHLNNAMQVALRQKEQVFTEVENLIKTLKSSAEYVIFLKGTAYTMCGASIGEGRIYSDIDLLVPKGDLTNCEQRLAIAGWISQAVNDYDDNYYRKWAHEIPPMAHGQTGTVIDVHHNIVPVISKASPNIQLLTQYKEEIAPNIFVLNAPAQLVHAAIHLFRNEDYRASFRDLTDLYLMMENQPDDFFEQAIYIASEIGFKKELALALRYVHQLLCLPLPAKALALAQSQTNIKQSVNDWIFSSVLLPQHDLIEQSHTPLKHTLAMMRGHFLKMPLHILIYHLTVKSCRGILESVFGEHIFTPKDEMPALQGGQAQGKSGKAKTP